MISNSQEIDIDALFNEVVHSKSGHAPPFTTDLEIDQAINRALAEIDETSNAPYMPLISTAAQSHQHQQQAYPSGISVIKQSPQAAYAPPTPNPQRVEFQSTPQFRYHQKTQPPQHQHQHQQHQLPREELISQQPTQLSPASMLSDDSGSPLTPSASSEYELTKMKELYEQKCKDLEIVIQELKSSEKKRFVLMKENRQLKEAVMTMTMEL